MPMDMDQSYYISNSASGDCAKCTSHTQPYLPNAKLPQCSSPPKDGQLKLSFTP